MKYLRGIGYGLATIGIYLGLPLLGWGLGQLGDFFSDYARAGYAGVVSLFGLAIGLQAIDAPEGIQGNKGDDSKRLRRQTVVRVVMVLCLYAALIFLPLADRASVGVWPANAAVRWLGLILSGLGYLLVFLSGLALGKQYSQEVTIQKDHQLITTGVFHYLRNPRYLGLIILALGMTGLFRSWLGLAASVALTAVLLFRIRDEETLLRQEFGPAWEAYCRTSWRLIPYLY